MHLFFMLLMVFPSLYTVLLFAMDVWSSLIVKIFLRKECISDSKVNLSQLR